MLNEIIPQESINGSGGKSCFLMHLENIIRNIIYAQSNSIEYNQNIIEKCIRKYNLRMKKHVVSDIIKGKQTICLKTR